MKKTISLLSLFLHLAGYAQQMNASAVANAERSFAAYSVDHGTKAAFLQFADSNAVVFDNGKAVNSISFWNNRENRPGILNWHPVYAFMATSGDLGFTTGPYTYQPTTIRDSVVARGQYSTLWVKKKNGEWKYLVDLGVSKTPSFEFLNFSFSDKPIKYTKGTRDDLLKCEKQFIRDTKEANSAARQKKYSMAVSGQAFFLNRNGFLPATRPDELETVIKNLPQKMDYTLDGSGISAAGDLGYVYGTMVTKGKTDNYLRIWRREGKAWKLALEVLRY